MTTLPRTLGAGLPDTPYSPCAIGTITQAAHAQGLAQSVDSALLDNPTGRLFIDSPIAGTYTVSYTPGSNVAFLQLEWWHRGLPTDGSSGTSGSAWVQLSISDGTNTIPHTDPRIPLFFEGSPAFVIITAGTTLTAGVLATRQVLDLAALRTGSPALTGSDWTLTFVANGFSGVTNLARIQGFELPRWSTDDGTAGRGLAPGDFLAGVDIDDSATTGIPHIAAACAAARTITQAVYLSLSWLQGIGDAPTTLSATDGPFGNLEENSTHPTQFIVPVRQIAPGAAAGAPVRWRVLYSTAGGVNLTVSMHTTSTSGPFSVTLADTGGSSIFAWSAWQTGFLNSTAGRDSISFTGKLSAAGSGKQAYLAAIIVQGNEP